MKYSLQGHTEALNDVSFCPKGLEKIVLLTRHVKQHCRTNQIKPANDNSCCLLRAPKQSSDLH